MNKKITGCAGDSQSNPYNINKYNKFATNITTTSGGVVPKNFIFRLRHDLLNFRTLSAKDGTNLAIMIWETGSSHRRHHGDPERSSFTYQELEQRFGRNRFNEINVTCKAFEVTSWSHANGLTRGFRLSEQAGKIKDSYLRAEKFKVTSLIGRDGKQLRRLPLALEAKDLEGVSHTAWRSAKLLNKCPVGIRLMQQVKTILEKLVDAKQADLFISGDMSRKSIECVYRILAMLLRLAKTDIAGEGYIMLRYAEASTGRLYARGTNLQNAPRLVRYTALHGLWNYDISNCHFAIFHQMSARYGFDAPNIGAYLADKNGTRCGLAERTEISVEDAKFCLIAILYGARASTWFESAIVKAIGQDAVTRLYADPVFCGIYGELQAGRKIIIDGTPKRPRTIRNAVGKSIGLNQSPAKVLAHLLQGVEVQALDAALALYSQDICLLLHDGFVSVRKLSPPRIEATMKRATGYEMSLIEEKIQLPADLLSSSI